MAPHLAPELLPSVPLPLTAPNALASVPNTVSDILPNVAFIIFCLHTPKLISVQSLKPTPVSQAEYAVWPILLQESLMVYSWQYSSKKSVIQSHMDSSIHPTVDSFTHSHLWGVRFAPRVVLMRGQSPVYTLPAWICVTLAGPSGSPGSSSQGLPAIPRSAL